MPKWPDVAIPFAAPEDVAPGRRQNARPTAYPPPHGQPAGPWAVPPVACDVRVTRHERYETYCWAIVSVRFTIGASVSAVSARKIVGDPDTPVRDTPAPPADQSSLFAASR
jgi:hypothetical protein